MTDSTKTNPTAGSSTGAAAPGTGLSWRARLPRLAARAAPALLVLWLGAIAVNTSAAEILLGLALAATLLARAAGPTPETWPHGWRSPIAGGETTRVVPWLVLAFVVWYIVSVLAAVDPTTSAGKLHKLFRYTLFFIPLAIPWRAAHWRAAFWIQIPVLVAVGWPAIATMFAGSSRAYTTYMHSNTLAQLAGGVSLLLLAAALFGPAARRRERALLLFAAAIATALLVATFSRAAWIGWWLGAVVLVLIRLPRRAALPTAVTLGVLALAVPTALRIFRPRMLDLSDPEFTRRFDMWRMARAIIADHPWTGVGPGGMGAVYDTYKTGVLVGDEEVWVHVHNDVLEIALSHGLPAAAIWVALALAFYGIVARRFLLLRRLPGSWLKAGFLGAAASLHLTYVCGLFHDNYPIFVKACLLLFFWGHLVALDRWLGPTRPRPPARGADLRPGVAAP